MADKIDSRLRVSVKGTIRWGEWEWRYVCEGALGAVEFWVRKHGDRVREVDPEGRGYSAGFETHTVTPARGAGAPDHGACDALSGRACWHDGSSTYGMESWLPMWLRDPHDHDAILRRLAREYVERFEPVEESHG